MIKGTLLFKKVDQVVGLRRITVQSTNEGIEVEAAVTDGIADVAVVGQFDGDAPIQQQEFLDLINELIPVIMQIGTEKLIAHKQEDLQ